MKTPSLRLVASCTLTVTLIACGLVPRVSLAILVAESAQNVAANETRSSNLTVSNNQVLSLDSNSSFYYDADAFLLNKKPESNNGEAKSKKQDQFEEKKTSAPASARPATRGGRMLNLDELMGDFSGVSARSMPQTGNRQSRNLASDQQLDISNGKKLKIQGFIPIIGFANGDDDVDATNANEHLTSSASQSVQQQQRPRELPYGQSSAGHATYGVQRYLNTEPAQQQSLLDQQQNTMMMLMQQQKQQQQQPLEAKFSGAISNAMVGSSSAVVDALKKPIKKLTSTFSSPASSSSEQTQQNCLCVPFYMCKNGYVSESSLSRSQLQQLIAQQPVQQQPRQLSEFPLPQGDQNALQQQPTKVGFVESIHLIDERSFEKQFGGQQEEIVTAPPGALEPLETMAASNMSLQQGSETPADATAPVQSDHLQPMSNVTSASEQNDYTQDILGRMLGIKSSQQSRISSGSGSQQTTGVCGLLRTCCNVPAYLFGSQADWPASNVAPVVQPQQRPAQYTELVKPVQQALQKYQPQQQQPYGLPVAAVRPSRPYAGFMNRISSNQYPNGAAARAQSQMQPQMQSLMQQAAAGQLSQLTRAASFFAPPSAMQTMAQAAPLTAPIYGQQQHQMASQRQPMVAKPTSLLGTRRLLEGRCGLRQAAGITGRVQNLQYHESSADFGEYPAQAAILKRLNGNESLFVCAGTLISQQWVATAAHCIRKHPLSELKVRLGEWDVHRDDEFYPYVEMEIRDLVVHPEFISQNLANDLALLRLAAPVDPSLPHINPACLPTIDELFKNQRCWVTGWGKDSFGQRGSFQAVLQEVELPVVGHGECEQALRQTRLGPHYRLHSGFICAGGEGGKDACEGDGGSGLYCGGGEPNAPVKVVGLVSWGIGCGQQGVPGVYVNLAYYRPWIENIISIDEDIYSSTYNSLQQAAPASTLISERSNTPAPLFNSTIGTDEAQITSTTAAP